MDLVKPYMDVALFTANAAPVIEFWRDKIGAKPDGMIPIREGHDQHRMDLSGSALKINALVEMPDTPPSGFKTVIVARPDAIGVESQTDPDGNEVITAPVGYRGVDQIGVSISVRDKAAHDNYFGHILGFERSGSDSYRVGKSVITLDEATSVHTDPEFTGPGWRYLTLQVEDLHAEIEQYTQRGGRIGEAVRQFGSAVRFATIRDPDGNWIELIQRATADKPFAD